MRIKPIDKMLNFSNKTALVTGGTRGIGKSIVDLLTHFGCSVIYTGRSKEPKVSNSKNQYLQVDFANKDSLEHFLGKIASIPKIDILVNNAGINIIEPIDEIKNESWEKVLSVNLTGAMILMREVSKKMKLAGAGRILNISSIFGVTSREKRNAYSASKAGLIGLTRASALDLAPYNILVNALCPGFTLTDLTAATLSQEERDKLSREIPLGRFAKPQEIAQVALFLCSQCNTYITGQDIIVDGGYSIR